MTKNAKFYIQVLQGLIFATIFGFILNYYWFEIPWDKWISVIIPINILVAISFIYYTKNGNSWLPKKKGDN